MTKKLVVVVITILQQIKVGFRTFKYHWVETTEIKGV